MCLLYIKILSSDPEVIKYYKDLEAKESKNSGVDIIFPHDTNIHVDPLLLKRKCFLLRLHIQCQLACHDDCDGNHGYFLMPRSSISKTPLRQSNGVGLIDQEYRGEICVPVDLSCDCDHFNLEKGQ